MILIIFEYSSRDFGIKKKISLGLDLTKGLNTPTANLQIFWYKF